MIAIVQGPPGNGKSFYAIRKVAQAWDAGKVVATNVALAPDAAERIARRNPVRAMVPALRRSRVDRLERALHVSEDLDELFALRLRGSGEARGVMVLDEAHNWMNARSWTAGDRANIVRFFSQHRKLGWDVYLIAQDAEMIDRQVRALAEYLVSLRNLRRAKFAGVPIAPVNLFLAIWRWHAIGSTVVKRECFPLGSARHLYDTFQTSHGLEADDDDAVWLPRLPEKRPAGPATGGDPSGACGGMPADPRNGEGPVGADPPQAVPESRSGFAEHPSP